MEDVIKARAWVVGDSVDTDNMYPGFAMKLPLEEAAEHRIVEEEPGAPWRYSFAHALIRETLYA